jgi:GT2 family glycosyltransferase/nucleoside-diphosphate-sugar epimerase
MERCMSRCSVIMVSHQTGPVMFAAIKSVLRQKNLAELIIVDNDNPPAVLTRLQQMALTDSRLVIMTGAGNVGFANAANDGAAHATAEFLLFLNPECLLPPDALNEIMAALESSQAMLAGGWLKNPDGSEERDSRMHLLTPQTTLAEALGLPHVLKKYSYLLKKNEMPADTHRVAAISSACMCIRTKDFQELGGFDEAFFLHIEDLDFCVRIHKTGGKIICVPRMQVTHMLSHFNETASRFVEWQKAKGTMRYFRKHFRGQVNPVLIGLAGAVIVARFGVKMTFGKIRHLLWPTRKMANTMEAKRLMILASGLADLPEKKDWYGKTVLVTGATGQVGLCVLKRLIASGAAVLALSRGDAIPFEHEYLRWIKGDLTDRNFNLQGYLVDIVIHCAPLWHLPPVIDLLADAEVKRIVAFGSTSIFGKALSQNPYEKDIVEKLAKSEMELSMRSQARGIQWTLLRPTLIYGVGLDLNITTIAKFIDRFGFFLVYPPAFGRRQPVHADDLAIAAMQAVEHPASIGKTYNVSGGSIITYHEMLEEIFTICQRTTRIIETTFMPFILDIFGIVFRRHHINGEIARRMNEDLVFFHDEATKDFGFNPRPFLSSGMKDIEGF